MPPDIPENLEIITPSDLAPQALAAAKLALGLVAIDLCFTTDPNPSHVHRLADLQYQGGKDYVIVGTSAAWVWTGRDVPFKHEVTKANPQLNLEQPTGWIIHPKLPDYCRVVRVQQMQVLDPLSSALFILQNPNSRLSMSETRALANLLDLEAVEESKLVKKLEDFDRLQADRMLSRLASVKNRREGLLASPNLIAWQQVSLQIQKAKEGKDRVAYQQRQDLRELRNSIQRRVMIQSFLRAKKRHALGLLKKQWDELNRSKALKRLDSGLRAEKTLIDSLAALHKEQIRIQLIEEERAETFNDIPSLEIIDHRIEVNQNRLDRLHRLIDRLEKRFVSSIAESKDPGQKRLLNSSGMGKTHEPPRLSLDKISRPNCQKISCCR